MCSPSAMQKPDTPPPRRVLVLGIGNDILTDDAVGLHVVTALSERLRNFGNLTVERTTQTGLALLDLIVGFDTLVVVDAVQTGAVPVGYVHRIEGGDLRVLPTVSPHFLGIGEMLALGAKLGLAVPNKVSLFAIEVKDPFTVGTTLTEDLGSKLSEIVESLADELRMLLAADWQQGV